MKHSATEADGAELRDGATRIEFALDALDQAEAHIRQVEQRKNQQEAEAVRLFANLDPLNTEEVAALAQLRVENGVLSDWLNNSQPLRDAVLAVLRQLSPLKDLIQTLAQRRSAAEATIAMCTWHGGLVGFEMLPQDNQVRRVRGTAKVVLGDIETLLSARIGITLTDEERRSGNLTDGPRVVRRLESHERLAGVADE